MDDLQVTGQINTETKGQPGEATDCFLFFFRSNGSAYLWGFTCVCIGEKWVFIYSFLFFFTNFPFVLVME